jgi:iron complex transport system substrate-binding protein
LKDVENAVCEWVDSHPQIVSLEPNALDDVWEDIRRVALALEAPEKANDLINQMKSRISKISEKARSLKHHPTVACIEWIDPLMAAGNWMPELVEMAGGENLFGAAGKHSTWMTWGELREKDPEVIAVMPCGFGLQRTQDEMGPLIEREDWKELRAVQGGQVYLTDGHQYFNRPGPRLVESLEILAEILHPTEFEFGHQGTGWEHL